MVWLLSIMQDQATNEFDKSCTLADYVLSGQRVGIESENNSEGSQIGQAHYP